MYCLFNMAASDKPMFTQFAKIFLKTKTCFVHITFFSKFHVVCTSQPPKIS